MTIDIWRAKLLIDLQIELVMMDVLWLLPIKIVNK
ncbi:hypothetical protein ABIB30_004452 [Pedobacter sp. UYP1]